ncbi:MAG: ABC transporter permease [Gemmatimonadetes bacterium]|nr:ABC transporter permease [Gemmatimonadota bacterium]
MLVLDLALKSLRNRAFSTSLTVGSIALSVALLVGVENVRVGMRESFSNTISQTDLIVGTKGGTIQLLLYSVFGMGAPTENVSWEAYRQWAEHPAVEWTIPYSLGDSHRGFRVIGTNDDFYRHYRYRGGQEVALAEGRASEDLLDVTLGADVAAELNYSLGDEIAVTHGLSEVGFLVHDHMPFTVVGVLAKTFTPVDRALYVTLEGMEAIHLEDDGHDHEAEAASADDGHDHEAEAASADDGHDHEDDTASADDGHHHEEGEAEVDGHDHDEDAADDHAGHDHDDHAHDEDAAEDHDGHDHDDHAHDEDAADDHDGHDHEEDAADDQAHDHDHEAEVAAAGEGHDHDGHAHEETEEAPADDGHDHHARDEDAAEDHDGHDHDDHAHDEDAAEDHDEHDHEEDAADDQAHDHDHEAEVAAADDGHDHEETGAVQTDDGHAHEDDGHAHVEAELSIEDVEVNQVTSFFVGTTDRRDVLQLQREINDFEDEPMMAVIPGVALNEMWRSLGYAETGLRLISIFVVLVGLLGMLVSLYTSLDERRREMAILRAVGAGPKRIVSLLVLESVCLAAAGALAGFVLVYVLLLAGQSLVEAQVGLFIPISPPGSIELLFLGAVVTAGFLIGFVPALKAYRTALHDGLTVRT